MNTTKFHGLPDDLLAEAQASELRSLEVAIQAVNHFKEFYPQVKKVRDEMALIKTVVDTAKNPEEAEVLVELLRDRVLELQRQIFLLDEHVVDVVEWPMGEDIRVLEKIVLHYQSTLVHRLAYLLNPFCREKATAWKLASQIDAVACLGELLVFVRGLVPGLVTPKECHRAGLLMARALSGGPLLDLNPQA
jgi:hypothetical protein